MVEPFVCAPARAATNPGNAPEATAPEAPIAPAAPAEAPESVLNRQRIMGVIPDYQTVDDSTHPVPPLTVRQKWGLALRETIDPFNLFNAAIGSGFSQAGNETPKYGRGGPALAERYGAALGDMATQNFFSAGVVATLLHQDPRYYRLGPQARIPKRIVYAVTRLVICRQDSGKAAFNASNILGMSLGIAASNLYYPSASVHGSVMVGRLDTSLFGGLTGNLMSEFWPDIRQKFFHHKQN